MFWMVASSTFSPMASSLCAPGTSLTLEDYGLTSKTTGTLMISIYVLGYAVGPLFLAPLSEMFGRVPVINASNLFFNAFFRRVFSSNPGPRGTTCFLVQARHLVTLTHPCGPLLLTLTQLVRPSNTRGARHRRQMLRFTDVSSLVVAFLDSPTSCRARLIASEGGAPATAERYDADWKR